MVEGRPAGQGSEAARAFERVDAQILRAFARLAEALGGDPRALLAEAGVDADAFLAARQGVTYRQMVELVERAAVSLDRPDFGMQLAARQAEEIHTPLTTVLRTSDTFGDALAFITRHSFAHSLAAAIWLRRLPDEDLVMVGHDILLEGLPNRAQAMEQILLTVHLSAMDATRGAVRAREVAFRHQPVSPPAVYRRYFGCDVRFGEPVDAVSYHARDLDRRIPTADPRARQAAIDFIDGHFSNRHPPLHAQVRGMVMHTLDSDDCTAPRAAALLGLNLRTLHRRLADEGSSFRRIKGEVRREALLYYARATDLDFTAVSQRLGFAEQAALTRFCRRWFAATPTQMRAQARTD